MHVALPAPKRFSIRGKVLFGFGFVLAMLVGIAFIAWKSTQRFLTTAEAVAHSREILETEEKVLRHLMEMESGRRGYLVTGDDRHLRGYEQAHTLLIENYRLLKKLIADDAPQLERTDKLRELISDSFAKQSAEIDVRRTDGFVAAEALFSKAESDQVTHEIYAILMDFEDRERSRLNVRSESTRFIGSATTLVILVGSSVTFVALLAAGWMIFRDIAARRRAETALAEQANLLKAIVDTMPDHVYLKDAKGRYILDNQAHRHYLGLHGDENVEGKTVHDFFPRDFAARYEADDEYVFSTGAPIRNREEPARPAAPNVDWLATTKMPLRDATGRIIGLVGVSTDITQRKIDEEKLRMFAEQLERSNAELASFASVASHDLQEPLRKIQAFGDRLRAKCAEQLGEQGLDYLARMDNAAQRMQTLIQDLLKLSRVTSRAQPFAACDLARVVGEVLTDLEVRIEQAQASIEVGELPVIDADPLQMRQLFQNLIANALKFQKPGVPPVVRIFAEEAAAVPGAQPRGRLCGISVQDNGIGFAPKFAEQIFAVFQRLHTKTEYEGTGIGLAVCRKITDRHGGTIVASSEEGRGATFIVTLPAKQPSEKKHE